MHPIAPKRSKHVLLVANSFSLVMEGPEVFFAEKLEWYKQYKFFGGKK